VEESRKIGARKEGTNTFKLMKENNCQSRVIYPGKLFFFFKED
jgi:hypothetical protein